MAGGWPSLPHLWPFGRLAPPVEVPPPEIVIWPDSLPEPAYTLKVGNSDVSIDVDADTLVFGSAMRGFGSLECDLILEDCNDVVSHELVEDAALVLYDNGVKAWQGHVVDLPHPAPEDPVQRIVGAGRFELARRNEAYGKFFSSDSPYDGWQELPVRILGDPGIVSRKLDAVTFDTDRQVLLTIPNGTVYKNDQGAVYGWWLFDGADPTASISRITADIACDPGSAWIFELYAAADLYGGPQTPLVYLASYSGATYDAKIDSDLSAYDARALILYAAATADGSTSADRYFQLRNLNVYAGTQAQRRIDEAIVEVLETDSGIAASSVSETIGSTLTDLVLPPDDTIAGVVEKIEARHSLPILSGIWEDDELTVKVKPTTPPDRTRHYVVSAKQDPIAWNVQPDTEARVDIVKVTHEGKPENDCASPTPTSTSWPAGWVRSTSTNVDVYNSGSDYWFHLWSSDTELDPVATYGETAGYRLEVTAGVVYVARFRCWNNSYDHGTIQARLIWLDGSFTPLAGATTIWSKAAADATEHWVERVYTAIAGAVYAYLYFEWIDAVAGDSQHFYFRDVELREFIDTGVSLVQWVPSAPTSPTDRVASMQAGYRTASEAIGDGQQYLAHYSTQASGQVEVPDFIRDIDGRIWPLSHIHAWDWIECPDYIDPEARGPFMITACEVSGGVARLGIGGVDTYAYDPPEKAAARRRRFIGAARVWRKVRVTINGKKVLRKRLFLREARYAGEKAKYTRVSGVKDRKL